MTDYPYKVFSSFGSLLLQAKESCRYSRQLELGMLDAGFIIQLHGKKLTKTDLRREARENDRISRRL